MSIYEILALSQGISGRIDIQWSLFITVHMAIFGGILYVDRPLKVAEKWVALFIYSGFSAINWTILTQQFHYLTRAASDVVTVAGADNELAMVQFYRDSVASGIYDNAGLIVSAIHAAMFVIVVMTVVQDSSD